MQKLSIVIPCYNERDTVRAIVERVIAAPFPDGWEREIIVVDDASDDGTKEVLAAVPSVQVITRGTNGGKGTALVDGFAVATGTHVLIQDADLEYDPTDIRELLLNVQDGVVVYGSRYLNPVSLEGSRLLRSGVRFLTGMVNLLYAQKLTDICTCYRVFPHAAAAHFPKGGFEADILFTPALLRAGYQIKELPISYTPRTAAAGKKLKYRDGLYAIYGLLADYIRHSGIMRTKPQGH